MRHSPFLQINPNMHAGPLRVVQVLSSSRSCAYIVFWVLLIKVAVAERQADYVVAQHPAGARHMTGHWDARSAVQGLLHHHYISH
jgi:hypothetical protein